MSVMNKLFSCQKNLLIGLSILTTTTILCYVQKQNTQKIFPQFFCNLRKRLGRIFGLLCPFKRRVKFPPIDKNIQINISNEELEEQFDKTCKAVPFYRDKISFEDWIILYGLYKQSTEGNIQLLEDGDELDEETEITQNKKTKENTNDFIEAEKRISWKYFYGVSPQLSKFLYVQHFNKLFPNISTEVNNENFDSTINTSSSVTGFANFISKMKTNENQLDTDLTMCDLFCQNAALNRIKEVKNIVELYPDLINQKNSEGLTALHYACDRGHLKIVKFLVEQGADVNVEDSYGETPLHIAKISDEKEIVDYLITKGADLNKQNYEGFTPESIPKY